MYDPYRDVDEDGDIVDDNTPLEVVEPLAADDGDPPGEPVGKGGFIR